MAKGLHRMRVSDALGECKDQLKEIIDRVEEQMLRFEDKDAFAIIEEGLQSSIQNLSDAKDDITTAIENLEEIKKINDII